MFNNKKSFNITRIFTEKLKNPVFRQAGMGGVRKKGWIWTVCRFKWGIWQKRGGGVFEGGVETPMHFIVFTSELSGWLVESLEGLPPLAHTCYQF